MSDFWTRLKLRFGSAGVSKKLLIQSWLVAIAQLLLFSVGCAFTVAGLGIAFGPIGAIIGAIGTTVLGWLYNAYVGGEEIGIRWFHTGLIAFISLPYFAVVTGYSLLISLIFSAGMTWAFDALRNLYCVLGVRMSSQLAA